MKENKIKQALWFRILMYIAIATLANTIIGMFSFIPAMVTSMVSRILTAALAVCTLKLAQGSVRYKKSALIRAFALVVIIAAEALHIGTVLTLPASLLSLIAMYHEYQAHSERAAEKDHELSGKWSRLFLWRILSGVVVGFGTTAAVMLTAVAGMDADKAAVLAAVILAVPEYIIDIAYILNLKNMAVIFTENA